MLRSVKKPNWMNEGVPTRYPMAAHEVLPSVWVLQAAFCQPCTGSQGPCLADISRNFPFGVNYFLTEVIMDDEFPAQRGVRAQIPQGTGQVNLSPP